MSPISAISPATSQPTPALLQLQLLQYIYLANSPNWQGKADYEALQNAIDAGDVSEAMVVLGRLQREAKIPSSQDSNATPPTPPVSTQTISDITSAPTSSVENSASSDSFNTTA